MSKNSFPASLQRSHAAAPTRREEVLDPDWLQSALADVRDGERIVRVEELDHSRTLAHKVRFAVTLERPDGSRRIRCYCVKAHFDDASPETLLTEAHVYRELLPTLKVRTPRAYYTGIDAETGRGLVIMDDVASIDGRFLNAHVPYSPDTCRDSLLQLARLHAATWGAKQWDFSWLEPRIASMSATFSADVRQRWLEDGRCVNLPDGLLDAGRMKRAMERLSEEPVSCVIHGDTHSGNVYLDADGRACWLDWQITQRGHWATDVSYHLASVLSIEDRRAYEQELLRSYLDALRDCCVEPPDWEEAWASYASGFVWGCFLWAITTISSREVVLIHMPRIATAIADHDSFGRLGVE